MHGLGVDLIHPVIAVVLVEIDLDAVGRRYAVQAVIVPHKRGGADGNVRRHKDAQCPGQHSAAAGRQLLDAGGDRREQHLEPGNRRKAPEEAVQQVDAPAQVERDRAVVPEHRTENDLGENTAQVLIRTAQQRAHDEQPAGGLVLVAVEQLDYIIVPSDDERTLQFYQNYGCSILGEVDGYTVLDTEID